MCVFRSQKDVAAGGSGAWKQCTGGSAGAAQGRKGCDADVAEHGERAWQRELQRRGGDAIAECDARWHETTEVAWRYVVLLLLLGRRQRLEVYVLHVACTQKKAVRGGRMMRGVRCRRKGPRDEQ